MNTDSDYIDRIYSEIERRGGEQLSVLQLWHRIDEHATEGLNEFKELFQELASETDAIQYEGRNNIGADEYSISTEIESYEFI